jgi:pimeloyl-ACP methyl ester carboxylesterase
MYFSRCYTILSHLLTAVLVLPYGKVLADKPVRLESFPVASKDASVAFSLYRTSDIPEASTHRPSGVLLIIPGFNGSGEKILDDRWKHFADEHSLVLLAPTFTSTNSPQELRTKGYYYPEQGSGAVIEEALSEVHRRTGAPVDKILIFGFSAGAHLAHRFALWKPDRVEAFVAYSAGWWSDPTSALRGVPALIMCGESDERYEQTRAFMERGMTLHLPWIWRSYKETGHQLTPAVRSMAEAFLAEEADRLKAGSGIPTPQLYGDIQNYQVVSASDRETIPEAARIPLPSEAVADVWKMESTPQLPTPAP